MDKAIKHLTLVLLFIFFSVGIAEANVLATLNSLVLREKPPAVYDLKELDDGFSSFYFEGAMYQEKPTRIFSYYRAPKGDGPFPAIVLVHGGGGSAFKEWIKKWNLAGFAAISIATEGQTGTLTGKKKPKWEKSEWGGPRRPGIYNDASKPLNDQWMNQAVTAALLAHNLVRSFDEVIKHSIGISGISWGGVITSTVIGFDQRFAFAIPIYGCGFLDEMKNKYGRALAGNNSYKDVWEPALRVNQFKKPTLWMTGLKENNFSLDAQAKTYKLLPTEHYQSIQPNLRHSHKHGWTPKEQYEFARSIISNKAIPLFYDQKKLNGLVSIKVKHISNVNLQDKDLSTLYYTNDTGHTFERKWHQQPVSITKAMDGIELKATVPKKATAWIFNLTYKGLIHSSEFIESSFIAVDKNH